ncbi:hypothetical protein ACJX0J_011584, partial [Zea mays]
HSECVFFVENVLDSGIKQMSKGLKYSATSEGLQVDERGVDYKSVRRYSPSMSVRHIIHSSGSLRPSTR